MPATRKVVDPSKPDDYMIIDEADYDPKTYQLWEDVDVPKQDEPPPRPAPEPLPAPKAEHKWVPVPSLRVVPAAAEPKPKPEPEPPPKRPSRGERVAELLHKRVLDVGPDIAAEKDRAVLEELARQDQRATVQRLVAVRMEQLNTPAPLARRRA